MGRPSHDDEIADILAMVEAVQDDRPNDFAILMANCDQPALIVVLIKTLQVLAVRQNVPVRWALAAVINDCVSSP